MIADLDGLGYKRVRFRSDGEPSLVAFLRLVRSRWSGEVVSELTVKGDPRTNGAAENGVRLLKGLARTLTLALEDLYEQVPENHGIVTWLVRYAATVHRSYAIGPDARTAYE